MKCWWKFRISSISNRFLCYHAIAYIKKQRSCAHSKIIFFGDSIANLEINGVSGNAETANTTFAISIPNAAGTYLVKADYRFILGYKGLSCAVSRDADCLMLLQPSESRPIMVWPFCINGITNVVVNISVPDTRPLGFKKMYMTDRPFELTYAQNPATEALNAVVRFECYDEPYEPIALVSGLWVTDFRYLGECNVNNLTVNIIGQKRLKMSSHTIPNFIDALKKRVINPPESFAFNLFVRNETFNIDSIESGNQFISLPASLMMGKKEWHQDTGNFSNIFAQINLHIIDIYHLAKSKGLSYGQHRPRFFKPLAHLPVFLDRVHAGQVHYEPEQSEFNDNQMAIALWLSLLHAAPREHIMFGLGLPVAIFTYTTLKAQIMNKKYQAQMQKVFRIWNAMRKIELFLNCTNGIQSVDTNGSKSWNQKEKPIAFTKEVLACLAFDVPAIGSNEKSVVHDDIDDIFETPFILEIINDQQTAIRVVSTPWGHQPDSDDEEAQLLPSWMDLQIPVQIATFGYTVQPDSALSSTDTLTKDDSRPRSSRSQEMARDWSVEYLSGAQGCVSWPQPHPDHRDMRPKDRLRMCLAFVDSISMTPLPVLHWEGTDSPFDVANAILTLKEKGLFKVGIFALLLKYKHGPSIVSSFICEVFSILVSNRNVQTQIPTSIHMSINGKPSPTDLPAIEPTVHHLLPILTSSVICGHYYPALFGQFLPDGFFELINLWSQPPFIRPKDIELLALGRGSEEMFMGSNRLDSRFDLGAVIFGGQVYERHQERLISFATNGKRSALETELVILLKGLIITGTSPNEAAPKLLLEKQTDFWRHRTGDQHDDKDPNQSQTSLKDKLSYLADFLIRNPHDVDDLIAIALMANPSKADRFVYVPCLIVMARRATFWTKLLSCVFSRNPIPRVSSQLERRFGRMPLMHSLDYTRISTWIIICSLGALDTWRSTVEPHVTPLSECYSSVKPVFFEMLHDVLKALHSGRNEHRDVDNVSTSVYNSDHNHFCLHHPSPMSPITEKSIFWFLLALFLSNSKDYSKIGSALKSKEEGHCLPGEALFSDDLIVQLMSLSIDDF